jgi:hypothetical protein
MALNIPQDFINIAKSITIDIDVDKLGKIQKNRLIKQLKSGCVYGDGLPARIAHGIRSTCDAPVVRHKYYSGLRWSGLDKEEDFKVLDVVAVATKLDRGYENSYRTEGFDAIKYRMPKAESWGFSKKAMKTIFTAHALRSNDKLDKIIADLESGVAGVISINAEDGL